MFARTDLTQKRRVVRALEIARTRSTPASRTEALAGQALLLAPFYRRAEVHRRIAARLDERLANGLVEEVRRLHEAAGLAWERLEFLGLEYRYVARYLQGLLTAAQMHETLLAHIRQFGKSQDVWFRKMEREGKSIHWLPGGDGERAAALVTAFLAGQTLPPPTVRLADTFYGPRSTPPGRRE